MPLSIRSWFLAAVIAFSAVSALAAAACSNSVAAPSDRTTETKTGVLPLNSAANSSFTVSKRGEVEIKLVSLTPIFANAIGLTLSQMVNGQCVAPGAPFSVIVGNTIPFGLVDPGTYCAWLIASPLMTTDLNYNLSITHP